MTDRKLRLVKDKGFYYVQKDVVKFFKNRLCDEHREEETQRYCERARKIFGKSNLDNIKILVKSEAHRIPDDKVIACSGYWQALDNFDRFYSHDSYANDVIDDYIIACFKLKEAATRDPRMPIPH